MRNLLISLLLFSAVSYAAKQAKLLTPAKSYELKEPIITTSFFHWLSADGGQMLGPWLPLEGRENWTGETKWWKSQIKQTMRAGIDVLYVHLIPYMERQRVNFFRALSELRHEGYDVPKIAPFLDPIVTWGKSNKYSLAVASNKVMFVEQYIRFFNQYFSVNTDEYAEDYIARIDNKILLDVWHMHINFTDMSNFHKSFISKMMAKKFSKKYPAFTNGVYVVTTDTKTAYPYADEKTVQFHSQEYFHNTDYNNIKSVQLKPGYWDQNHRTPGFFLKRDGGICYSNAWARVLTSSVDHVYIESWNEYTEGTGIYAADPTNIFKINSNTNNDFWSVSNDPFEYIKTTYSGARKFKNIKNKNTKILWHNLPKKMFVGETNHCTVCVRNTGFDLWKSSGKYKFGQRLSKIKQISFCPGKYNLEDKENEVDLYSGVFKGRPVQFDLIITEPKTPGGYKTYWRMIQGKTQWFGEEITNTINVISR